MKGYIKLHRAILDNGVFENAELLKVFVWCILRANAKPKAVRGIELEVGQFITGRVSAAEELHLKPSTVYNRMKALEAKGYIKISSNARSSVITVINYEEYQLEEKKKRDLQKVHDKFVDEVLSYDYSQQMLEAFVDYWTEPNRSQTKLRFELEKTWSTKRRLATWSKRQKDYKKTDKKNIFDTWQEARDLI